MRAEVGAESPIWTEQGEMVWLDQLPVGPELRDALVRWANDAWHHPSSAEGEALHAQLREELGPPTRWNSTSRETP
jgi:hypothetical protein